MLGLLPQAGCGALAGFACSDDAACRPDGICTEEGACAYPDATCPSGRRFSNVAAVELKGRCVEVDADVTSSLSATDPSTGTTTDDEETGDPSSSSSTGPLPAVCGDGVIEQDEECDPPTQGTAAPRCNERCTFSGKLLDEYHRDFAGTDVAYAVVAWDGDIAIAGQATWDDGQGTDIHVARHAGTDLREVWSYRRSGSGASTDVARSLAVADSGTLRVAGYLRVTNEMARPDQIWIAELDAGGTLTWEDEIGDVALVEQAFALALIEDSQFVLAGRSAGTFLVQRWSIGDKGRSLDWSVPIESPGGGNGIAHAIAVYGDAIIAGGSVASTAEDIDRYLTILTGDGVLAEMPCDDGPVMRPADADDEIFGVAVRQDGGIVAVGRAQPGTNADAWLGVYEPGSCAPLWQRSVDDGDVDGADRATAVAIDAQGDIITVGWKYNGVSDDAWIAKWDSDEVGEIVWEATRNGDLDALDRIHAVTIDEIGRIVVAGQVTRASGSDIWIARWSP